MSNQFQSKKVSAPAGAAFDPWLLWVALRRHWAWVIFAGMIFAAVGAVVLFVTFEPEYEATHILQANHEYVLSKDFVENTKDLARNERLIILSPEVLGEVLGSPKLNSVPSLKNQDTRDFEIRRRLKISNGGTDDLLMISYRDTDKNQVAEVANEIAEEYKKERKRYDDQRLKNLEKSLLLPIDQARRNVEEARRHYEDLSEKIHGRNPFKSSADPVDGESTLSQDRRALVDLDLREGGLSASLAGKQAELGYVPQLNFDDQEIKAYIDSDEAVQKLRAKIAYNDGEIKKIEQKEQEGFFATRYRDLKRDVNAWEAELVKLVANTREKAQLALRDKATQRLKHEISAIELQMQEVKARREAISEGLKAEEARLAKFGVETADLVFANKKLNYETEYYDKLNTRFFALRAEQGKGSSIVSRSIAKPPTAPIEETPIKKILMASAVAFLIPYLLAVVIEFLAKRITRAESVDSNQLIPILGEIAQIPTGRKRSTGQRMFEESIDAMRANLLFKMEDVRSIAVTSAMSGEGKSNIAFQLAFSIARCTGESVLVIDADLRNPDQQDLFGLEQGPGLCKLLKGEAMLDKCIDNNEGDLVHLLSAGRLDTNPHNLLTKNNFEKLLAQVSCRYRYVVVDTAPVLPAAETLAITATCDATLLCAMRDVSQAEHVKRTFARLDHSGANVIGTVFSGVPSRLYASKYGDYRYVKN